MHVEEQMKENQTQPTQLTPSWNSSNNHVDRKKIKNKEACVEQMELIFSIAEKFDVDDEMMMATRWQNIYMQKERDRERERGM